MRLAHSTFAREQMLWLLVHETAIALANSRVLIHLLLTLFQHFSRLKVKKLIKMLSTQRGKPYPIEQDACHSCRESAL